MSTAEGLTLACRETAAGCEDLWPGEPVEILWRRICGQLAPGREGPAQEGKRPTVQTTNKLRRHRLFAVAALGGLLIAACSAQGGESTTTEDITTTTSRETTSTPSPSTTTTTTAASPTTGELSSDTNDLASRSGCKPGTEDSLPDGEWYGYIVDVNASEIEFDLACWFSGDAAVTAASEDGAESPPPNDYYVRNESATLRSLAVESSAEVEYLASGGDPNSVVTAAYENWYVEWEISEFVPGYWLTIADGQVTRIVQQYVP